MSEKEHEHEWVPMTLYSNGSNATAFVLFSCNCDEELVEAFNGVDVT